MPPTDKPKITVKVSSITNTYARTKSLNHGFILSNALEASTEDLSVSGTWVAGMSFKRISELPTQS